MNLGSCGQRKLVDILSDDVLSMAMQRCLSGVGWTGLGVGQN